MLLQKVHFHFHQHSLSPTTNKRFSLSLLGQAAGSKANLLVSGKGREEPWACLWGAFRGPGGQHSTFRGLP